MILSQSLEVLKIEYIAFFWRSRYNKAIIPNIMNLPSKSGDFGPNLHYGYCLFINDIIIGMNGYHLMQPISVISPNLLTHLHFITCHIWVIRGCDNFLGIICSICGNLGK